MYHQQLVLLLMGKHSRMEKRLLTATRLQTGI
jgi:hypothetical protein